MFTKDDPMHLDSFFIKYDIEYKGFELYSHKTYGDNSWSNTYGLAEKGSQRVTFPVIIRSQRDKENSLKTIITLLPDKDLLSTVLVPALTHHVEYLRTHSPEQLGISIDEFAKRINNITTLLVQYNALCEP